MRFLGSLPLKKVMIGGVLITIFVVITVFFALSKPLKALQTPTTAIPSSTATFTPTATDLPSTATPLPSSTTTVTPEPLPDSYYIEDISGHRQVYELGCEAGASVDWAGFFGTNIYEYDFQVSLPLSDNPDYGFVGDVNSNWGQVPPFAYGVYAGPVADLLNQYGLPAKAVKNYTLDEVKRKLSDGKPIIVWVIGNMVWSPSEEYTDSQGRTTLVAAYEHVVILTGYNQDSVRYMTNGRFYDTPTDVFMTSWGVLGNMAVIYDSSEPQ
jgi:uncharacterized protein YvpB